MIVSTPKTSTRLKVLLYSRCSYSVLLFYALNVSCKEVENVIFFSLVMKVDAYNQKNQSELKNIKHRTIYAHHLFDQLITSSQPIIQLASSSSLQMTLESNDAIAIATPCGWLKKSRASFSNQWEATLNAPYKRDFSRVLCNCDWLIVLFAHAVTGWSNYFGIGDSLVRLLSVSVAREL